MNNIRGNFNSGIIRDTRGATSHDVSGNQNDLRFVGDSGANTFRVGGAGNRIAIENIGKDERVVLEGRPQDWAIKPDSNARDGMVTYVNGVTGNEVTVRTDAGRSDAFVKSRVEFSGDYRSLAQNPCDCSCASVGGWNNLGNMSMNPGCFNPITSAYAAGYSAGRQDGYGQGFGNGYGFGYGQGFGDGLGTGYGLGFGKGFGWGSFSALANPWRFICG